MAIEIFMDDREDRNTVYKIDFWARGYEVVVQRQGADFAVPSLGIGIERKTIPDFVQSVHEGRIFSQADELRSKFEWAWIIIDDDPAEHTLDGELFWATKASLRHHHGCWTDITYGRLPVWLHYEIKKMTQDTTRFTNPLRKVQGKAVSPYDYTMNTLLSLPGIGPVNAKEVAHLKLIEAIRELNKKNKIRKEYREWVE